MTLQNLASLIAHAEGKKHEASVGDIREILKLIVDMSAQADTDDQDPVECLYKAAADKAARAAAARHRKGR